MNDLFEKMNAELNEMAQVGQFESFSVYLYGNEGSIPHFHIIQGNPQSPSWQTCICINTADYFHHQGKEEVLNTKQKKALIDFLGKPSRHIPVISNWTSIVVLWNQNNPQWEINKDTPMPDYNLL